MTSQPKPGIDLANRLALDARELAKALGVSERLVRDLRSEIPWIRLRGRVVYPVDEVRRWMSNRAKAERNQADAIAEEILDGLGE